MEYVLIAACVIWAVIFAMGVYSSRGVDAQRRANRQKQQEWRASWVSSPMQDAMEDGE